MLRRARMSLTACLAVVQLAACESTENLGHTGGPLGSQGAPPASTEQRPSLMPPEAASPLPPAYLRARCEAAHGPVDGYAKWTDLTRKLVGRWFSCSQTAGAPDVFRREAGIEFHADGTWNLLHLEANGNFVSAQGIEGQGTWSQKYQDPATLVQISKGDEIEVASFAFERDPQRMRATEDCASGSGETCQGMKAWLVPIGDPPPPTR